MALAMARPWKHPKTGIYWFRKRVPDELRARLGKTEEKQSLGTRDPAEAKIKQLEVLAAVEVRWANLKAGPRTLSEREAHEFARSAHDRWLARYRDNPSQQPWPVELGTKLFPAPLKLWDELAPIDLTTLDTEGSKIRELEAWCMREVDADLAVRGLQIDDAGRLTYAKAIAAAILRASLTLAEMANGYAGPTAADAVINGAPVPIRASAQAPVSFDDLVKGWAAEKKPAAKTLYAWKAVVEKLKKSIGHDDAARLTPDDMLRWKASLIEAEFKPKTIRDANLVPIRAILQWAVDNRKLPSNPAERVTMDVKSKAAGSRRSYTEVEAKTVLAAAAKETDAVKRWVPFLCAYSGARVAEICQLRFEDIVEIDGIWCFKIDPQAGSIKTAGSERAVPLHPALIEAKFLDFVRKVKKGPLFADLPADRFGSRGGNGTKVLGRWVRNLGLTDERLAPNHSWRHRLKTLGRRHGLAPDIVDAITGHQRKTVADTYGEFPMEALHRELSKIPTLKLS
ncbi:site-specific integrase [Bosea sp. BH3]|uniref:site-specific integrase n=1 Tax=Bosea sp. BH3 TaxID=2871701 RepID=UPI0021CB854F|nr:site-specific integrase [Bosea sp. BH3]MCU4181788.1 site-specific integrase [Bosea sp. BH3]